MRLSFYAKGDILEPVPGIRRIVGRPPRYVGRTFVRGTENTPASHPAVREEHVVASESPEGRRLARLCERDYSLWPADEQTAKFCRRPFVPLKFIDGEWVEIPPPAPSPKTKGKTE